MKQLYVLPVLALIGLGVAVATIVADDSTSLPVAQSKMAPFGAYVAGAGMVEARTENISIGTPVSGIVTEISAKWSDWVKAGDPLFKIDDRDLRGQMLPAAAKVREAEANLAKLKNFLDLGARLGIGPISALDLSNRRFDVATAEAVLASSQAQVEQLKIEMDRRIIRAPAAGRLLQIKIRVGEFAQSGVLATPLMLLGDDSRLHVRVDVDENDAWRVRPDAPALGYVRGNPELKAPLRFERIERYVVPKVSLTGDSTERTDMRVLQVVYSFDPNALPVYVGQQMDVFIEAVPTAARGEQPTGNAP